MAEKEKFIIEIFRKKSAEDLIPALADPAGKLDLGSSAALAAADGCAMALRAARVAAEKLPAGERLDYIARNLEKLCEYFVYLIDEDVKGLNILRRAIKEGDPRKVDAARQPANSISNEVICQACNVLELLDELTAMGPEACSIYAAAAVRQLSAAFHTARLFAVNMARQSSDETFAFITRRENDINLENYGPVAERILSRVEEQLN